MVGSKTLKATLIGTTALVGLAFLMAPTPARAVGCADVTITTGVTSPALSLCTGEHLTVQTGAAVRDSLITAAAAVGVFGTVPVSVNNAGTIVGTISAGGHGTGIEIGGASSSLGSITNSGLIGGYQNGIALWTSAAITNGIVNTGIIESSSAAGGQDGIHLESSTLTGDINNSGVIESLRAPGHQQGIDVANGSTITGNIINHGDGALIHGGAQGILVRGDALDTLHPSYMSGAVENGVGSVISGGSSGIVVASSSDIHGGIVNGGTIEGAGGPGGASPDPGNGIALFTKSAIHGGILNNAGGEIFGAVGYGIAAKSTSSIAGGITNSGYIHGAKAGIYLDKSALTGDIVNHVNTLHDGLISGGVTGIKLSSSSTIVGAITNSGLIKGTTEAGINLSTSSDITGGITNSATGTIHGDRAGIEVRTSSTITGDPTHAGITNSGTIDRKSVV